ASIPDRDRLARLSPEERRVAFPLKPLWQRAIIVAAGPLANFVLAVVILAGFLMVFGTYMAAPVINKVVPGSAAAQAGFRIGDTILSVNGTAIQAFDETRGLVWDRGGETLTIRLQRQGKIFPLHVTPRPTVEDLPGGKQKVGILGISGPTSLKQWKHVTYGPVAATAEACRETWSIITTTFEHLWRILA